MKNRENPRKSQVWDIKKTRKPNNRCSRGLSRQAYSYVKANHLTCVSVDEAVHVWTGELVSPVNTLISLQFVYVNLPPIKWKVQRRQDLYFVLLYNSLWVCGRSNVETGFWKARKGPVCGWISVMVGEIFWSSDIQFPIIQEMKLVYWKACFFFQRT